MPIRQTWQYLSTGFLVAAALAASGPPASRGAGPDDKAPGNGSALPAERLLGRRIANFTLKDVRTGKPVSLYGFRGQHALVLVFLGSDCPVGNLYAPRLAEIAAKYGPKKVTFLGINSNAHDTAEQATAHAREHGLTFPVMKDENNVVADQVLAERTCEVLVLDGMATLRYRGAVDDQYGVGTRKDAATKNYMTDALDEVLVGGRVETKTTPVVGCLIDRADAKPVARNGSDVPRVRPAHKDLVEALAAEDAAVEKIGPVTYASDVATIVANRCQNCHRPGEVAPFSLLTFDDVRKHSAMIREVVDDRRMPPWHADPRFGHFANARRLSARERAVLLAWVDQGTPLGDSSKLPPPKKFAEGWSIGTPDVVFQIPDAFTVPAQGTVEYMHFRVPTNFKEDVWVQAAEARPTERKVVHHIIVYVKKPNLLAARGGNLRSDSHLVGYAPGDMPSVYPEGSAKLVPAGSELLFEVHYTPDGKQRTDRSKVGLIFAKAPVTQRAHTLGIAQARFQIPPGAENHPVRSTFKFPNDAKLLSLMPHMHLRGKSFEYEAVFPDGRRETLLKVPAFDFGWQSYYTLAEPLAMPKGTVIECLAHFDNSDKNPANPDPRSSVRWGEQTWEEMMIGYIDYLDDAKPNTKTASATPAAGDLDLKTAVRAVTRAAAARANADRPSGR